MDSPGHSAQYCTYSLMETNSNSVLSIQTVDKRETNKKSPLMEKAGFLKALNELRDKNVNVTEVVTDQHVQISSLMSTN